MGGKRRAAKTHSGSASLGSVLGPAAFAGLSWYFYTDHLLESALIFYAYAVGVVIIVLLLLHFFGIFRDTMIEEFGPIGFIFHTVLFAAGVGPLLIMLVVGFVSIAAIYVQAIVAIPWKTLSLTGCVVAALIAVGGPILQSLLWKRASEDYVIVKVEGNAIVLERVSPREQMLRRYATLPLTFLGTHIVLRILGWTPFSVTIGSFMGAVYAIFFLPMFLCIAIMRAIAFRAEPVSKQACEFLSEAFVFVRPDGFLETIWWLADIGWKFVRLPMTNPTLFELVMGILPAPAWYDVKWEGSINLASYLIVAASAASCIAGGF